MILLSIFYICSAFDKLSCFWQRGLGVVAAVQLIQFSQCRRHMLVFTFLKFIGVDGLISQLNSMFGVYIQISKLYGFYMFVGIEITSLLLSYHVILWWQKCDVQTENLLPELSPSNAFNPFPCPVDLTQFLYSICPS